MGSFLSYHIQRAAPSPRPSSRPKHCDAAHASPSSGCSIAHVFLCHRRKREQLDLLQPQVSCAHYYPSPAEGVIDETIRTRVPRRSP